MCLTIADDLVIRLALDVTEYCRLAFHQHAKKNKKQNKNKKIRQGYIRSKAYTTSILFIFGIVKTLPCGQGLSPAIAVLGIVLGVLVGDLVFNYRLAIDFLQVQTHTSAGDRQKQKTRVLLSGCIEGCQVSVEGGEDVECLYTAYILIERNVFGVSDAGRGETSADEDG